MRWEKVNVPFSVEVKDVNAPSRAKTDALIAANPANEVFPLQAAITFAADKNWDEALKYVDQSIKTKPTFRNLSARANILRNAGKEGRSAHGRRAGHRQSQSRRRRHLGIRETRV